MLVRATWQTWRVILLYTLSQCLVTFVTTLGLWNCAGPQCLGVLAGQYLVTARKLYCLRALSSKSSLFGRMVSKFGAEEKQLGPFGPAEGWALWRLARQAQTDAAWGLGVVGGCTMPGESLRACVSIQWLVDWWRSKPFLGVEATVGFMAVTVSSSVDQIMNL